MTGREDENTSNVDGPSPSVIDLRGLNCPYPVLKAAKVLRTIAIGERLILECTDPLTAIDVPHFANQSGHSLLRQWREGPIFAYEIERGR